MIEHKSISLADQVFEHIETEILGGRYCRGEILTESKLSAELGVSRTPIREALRRLEQEHLIEESGKGSVVIGISESDLKDIFLIRRQIEGFSASLVAENRTDEQLNELKEVLELQEFYLEKSDSDQIKKMDNRFHYLIYKMSGSNTFYDILVPLHKKIQKYRKASVENKSRAAESVAEHRDIYEAIAKRDGEAAAEAVRNHINNAYKHITRKEN